MVHVSSRLQSAVEIQIGSVTQLSNPKLLHTALVLACIMACLQHSTQQGNMPYGIAQWAMLVMRCFSGTTTCQGHAAPDLAFQVLLLLYQPTVTAAGLGQQCFILYSAAQLDQAAAVLPQTCHDLCTLPAHQTQLLTSADHQRRMFEDVLRHLSQFLHDCCPMTLSLTIQSACSFKTSTCKWKADEAQWRLRYPQ